MVLLLLVCIVPYCVRKWRHQGVVDKDSTTVNMADSNDGSGNNALEKTVGEIKQEDSNQNESVSLEQSEIESQNVDDSINQLYRKE